MNNAQRAARFAQAIKTGYAAWNFEDPANEGDLSFVLSDALHYCATHGMDYAAAERLAALHFEAERDDPIESAKDSA